MNSIQLGSKIIDDHSLYFIADIGANHNGSLAKAIDLIRLAREAGADAAKFQNFQADKIVSKTGFEALQGNLSHQSNWKKSVFEVYQDASIDPSWTPLLKKACDEAGIDYFTSPYDFDSVDRVDPYVDLYKIGSGDISWLEMIEYIAGKGKPVLLATGAATMDEVRRAMDALTGKTNQIVLMQCNTNYTGDPANFQYCNLNVLKRFGGEYPDAVLGLSDHTAGHATVLGSLALGARVFEKHFTDDNDQDGPDHGFAMNPNTWRDMVDRSYELLSAMGDGIKRVEPNEAQSRQVQRRCLRVNSDLPAGHILTEGDLTPLRPLSEGGYQPYEKAEIIGKSTTCVLKSGDHLTNHNIK
ncbi:MAG: N-acetylneuraminate synthase family protein [Verrucomicrobiota bacterium]